jgi:hypothetical protein
VGKQYEGYWRSVNDVDWSVELHNSSSAATRELKVVSAEIQRDGEGDTFYDNPIRASRASVTFVMRDSSDYGNFELFGTSAEQVYDMRIYREGSLYWVGRVLADQMRFQREAKETGWATVNVQAVDGLTLLKNYDVSPAWFTDGRSDIISLFINILNSVELHTAWSSDPYIHECTNIANANDNGENVLFHTVRDLAFVDNVDIFKDGDELEWTDCYTALERILTGVLMGARMFHSDGVYWIVNPANYNIAAAPDDLTYTIWDETGSFLSTSNTYTHKKLIDTDTDRPKFETFPEISNQPAVRLVESQFERTNGIIESRITYSTAARSLTHDDIVTAGAAPGRMCKLYYDLEFNYYNTGLYQYQLVFNIYAYNPSTLQKYMLKEDGYWIAASTIKDLVIQVDDVNGNTNSKRVNGSWTTTAPPTGATQIIMSVTVKRYTMAAALWVWDAALGRFVVSWSTPSTASAFFRGTLAIGQSYTSSEPFPFTQKANYISDLNAPRDKNSVAPVLETSFYSGRKYEVGSIMVYNSADYVAAGAWSAPWTAYTGDLPELLANTWAGVYADFRNSIRATVHDDGTYSAANSFYFDSQYWILNGCTHNLYSDTWDGEWVAILKTYTNVTNNGEGQKVQDTNDYIIEKLNRVQDEISSTRQFLGQIMPAIQLDIINNGESAPTSDPATDKEYVVGLKYNYNSGNSYFEWKVREYVSPSAGSFAPDVTVVTTNTTITQTSGYVIYDASSSSGNITLAAPTAVANTAVYVIKNSGATHNVIFDCAGSETIDGAGTFTINAGDSITVYSDGSNYKVV